MEPLKKIWTSSLSRAMNQLMNRAMLFQLVNNLKILTLYSILFGPNFAFYAGVSQNTKWNCKHCRPRSDCFFRSSLSWVCTVCICHFFSNFCFVCVEVLRPSQPNGVMSSAVSLPNHTFTGQALSSKRLTSNVHILQELTTALLESAEGRE